MNDRASLLVSVMFLTAVAGLSAAALDVSTWYRTNRKQQAGTDGAALAGAQALPDDPRTARSLAGAGKVTFSTSVLPNDTITVRRSVPARGFLAGMLGGSAQIKTKAVARAGLLSKARWTAPIGVDARQRALSGPGCPCWNRSTTVPFRLIDLDGSRGGTGADVFGSWIRDGFDGYMAPGWYSSDSGATLNSPQIRHALSERFGSELLFPIYHQTRRGAASVEYRVIGWAGFHLTGYSRHHNKSTLHGWFERVIWDGMQSESRSENDFGVRTVALIS
jgi:putative Flp pilus-assembly TadE/G-like protein